MIEAEASEEYSPENKGNDEIMRDKDLVQKSQSPKPNGETSPNNANKSQLEKEGSSPNELVLEKETPMKRLITALKQARAEKDAREAEEREKLMQEQVSKSLQSPVNKSNTFAFGIITVADEGEKSEIMCIIRPDNSFKGIWDIVITM